VADCEWSLKHKYSNPFAMQVSASSLIVFLPSLYFEWQCITPFISRSSINVGRLFSMAKSISIVPSLNSGSMYGRLMDS
jgi:hypothetical protein